MDIQVGEYIRLKNGKILEYGTKQDTKIQENTYIDYSGEYETSSSIVKHSFNIIDLIEVGDYVNGCEVKRIWEKVNIGKVIDLRDDFLGLDSAKYIESIVTKEQFKCIEYRLEE